VCLKAIVRDHDGRAVTVANPHRPTPTRKLVAVGVLIGLVVAVVAFMLGADQGTGVWFGGVGRVATILAVVIAGGWSALRRKKRS
jgi:hypothetical protein